MPFSTRLLPSVVLRAAVLACALLLAGCSSSDTTTATADSTTSADAATPTASGSASQSASADASEQEFPDVQAVELRREDDGTYSALVTISSPYDTPERYADGWRVLGEDGDVLGEMTLGHDHADEQPFTRMQSGLEVPDGTETLTVEGRDSENGYGGTTVQVEVP